MDGIVSKVRMGKTYSVSLETIARIKDMAKKQGEDIGKKVSDAEVIEQAINAMYNKIMFPLSDEKR